MGKDIPRDENEKNGLMTDTNSTRALHWTGTSIKNSIRPSGANKQWTHTHTHGRPSAQFSRD